MDSGADELNAIERSVPASRRGLVVAVVVVVVLLCLVLLCLALLRGSPDQGAKERLITTVSALERSHQDRTTSEFRSFTLAELRARVPALTIAQGGENLGQSNPGSVGVTLCATGPSCDAVVVVTRGANGTCWYAALAYSPAAGRALGFQTGMLGLHYGVTAHATDCRADEFGHTPRPRSGWQEDPPPSP